MKRDSKLEGRIIPDQTGAESETPLRTLVASLPGAAYRRAAEAPWHFSFLSDAVESIVGRPATDIVPPGPMPGAVTAISEDLPAVTDAIRSATESGQPYDLEYRVRHADGTVRWIHDRGQPERGGPGAAVCIDGVIFDVTKRKLTEQQLEIERARLMALMETIPDKIYFKDAASRFTMIGKVTAKSFGLRDPSAAIGKTDFDFFTEDHARPAFEAEQEMMRTGRPVVDLEEHETWPDGHETWASTTKLPYTDARGRIIGTFGISRDITARKTAQVQAREGQRRLEAALTRSTEMTLAAEQANSAKSDFLANMSHEIRTPMNGVIGMVGLLLDTELDEDQRHYAETVRASSEALLELLNDILDFSKIEAGGLELENVGFDLRAMLDDFATMPAMRAHGKGLEFICATAPDVPANAQRRPGPPAPGAAEPGRATRSSSPSRGRWSSGSRSSPRPRTRPRSPSP